MITRAIQAALLRREPYVVMVVRADGVADGAIVVAVVHAILMILPVLDGAPLLTAAQVVLSGVVAWIVISGLIYLIGRHLLDGYGSFPGVMAATSIGFPVLLAAFLLAPFYSAYAAVLIVSAWLVATLWMAARASLELAKGPAALAAIGGWVGYVIVSTIFRL